MQSRLWVTLVGCVFVLPGWSGELVELSVTHKRKVYEVYMDMVVYAPEERVRAVLTDYENIGRLNPSISESEVLAPPDEETARVRTLIRGCALLRCVDMERVEDVRELENGDLQAVTVPELSAFKSAHALWQIIAMGQQTRVIYRSTVEPDFWIPPLFGPAIVKRNLREEILLSFKNLEDIAQQGAAEGGE